ncbi:MAG: methionine--tRNA ligase [Spirochaetaceae bacterium]|jgi:methionyl-tRNA synthetase|nr:methionine--tRNA ligase [Spirochaetaceae bacterium]
MKKRLITSALPYVNNVPHLGNLIQVLSADCCARFCRLRGYDTLYVCGTDEYGTATETRAAEEGIAPRELCDRFWAVHNEIDRWFGIDFDKFGRTSTAIQTEIVQEVFAKLRAGGFIHEKTGEQLFCRKCGRFLADRFVLGECPACGYGNARGDQCEACGKLLDPTDLRSPRCASCGSEPELRSTSHLYIDLPALRQRLEAWIQEAAPRGKWARNAVRMTEAWIRDGLHERAITRDLSWGIPVPLEGYEKKVFYVWFDAPIGYVSITGALAAERGEDWRAFVDAWWKNPGEVELFQFIGKDNIPFHTVVFPCSQLGSGENWTMLHHMSSTEYLNYESGKFSKSNGVGVFGTDVMETGIPADVWRFYIFYNRPEKSDALFTWKDLYEKVNGELIGNLGNLVNRTVSFVARYYGGTVPRGAEKNVFWGTIREYEADILGLMEWAELRDAFHRIFELAAFANKTFQDGEPWKKRESAPEEAASLIAGLCYIVRDLAILCFPFIPRAAQKMAACFGKTIREREGGIAGEAGGGEALDWSSLGVLEGLETAQTSGVLFQKLEEEHIARLRDRYAGNQKEREKMTQQEGKASAPSTAAPSTAAGAATVDAAARFAATVDLRVAKIIAVEKHPSADKLYIEKIDLGAGEERTIVSGLVPYYTAEELLGRSVIVAYNLKEAKLRGVASRGMLIAASAKNVDGGETVEVLDAAPAAALCGTRVTVAGCETSAPPPEEITIDDFFAVPLEVRDGFIEAGGAALLLNGAPLRTTRVVNGSAG